VEGRCRPSGFFLRLRFGGVKEEEREIAGAYCSRAIERYIN
jgi:hypothetical protein